MPYFLKTLIHINTLSIHWAQVVNELPSSIPDGNNSWPDFPNLVAGLWTTWAPFPWDGNQREKKTLSII
jgi:hypothetical protein